MFTFMGLSGVPRALTRLSWPVSVSDRYYSEIAALFIILAW